jgi:predicted ATPase/DNA-binding SARP family transcriptional activator
MTRASAAPEATEIRFGLLGPLEVSVRGRVLPLGGLRPRTLLAMLLTAHGATVSEDAIIEALWGEHPPTGARNSLQSHVSRLRAALAGSGVPHLGDRLARQPRGYRFDVASGELDVERVTDLLDAARASTASPTDRVRLLEAARACWRGPALVDLADAPGYLSAGLAASQARLDELEAAVHDELAAAHLESGGHLRALRDLEEWAGRHPDREPTQRLLALALHRNGRTADGLAVLRRYRERLADETGLDPSAALEELERRLLTRDPGLDAPAGAETPPRSAAVPTASPAPRGHGPGPALAPLIGRREELADLADSVSTSRLVTVTGPGGVGKTRLVRELIAARLRGPGDASPVVLELSSIRRADAVVPALAALLDVQPGPGREHLDALVSYLTAVDVLLVVDNCEHLLSTVADLVHHLLTGSPSLQVLATSRMRLGIDGEQVVPLAPLSLPAPVTDGDADGVEGSDAVRLFVDRATRTRPSFALTPSTRPIVADVCRQLDGLPLAIELAAAQLGALGLADLRDRLDDRLDLFGRVTHGPDDERHATLRAVVASSYGLLDEPARVVFEQLAVFEGGFTLAATERVVRMDGPDHPTTETVRILRRLVDASLITTDDDGHGRLRYGLLETLRTFGLERLQERGGYEDAAARHRAWVLGFVEGIEPALDGPEEAAGIASLRTEFANVRAAWHGAVDGEDLELAARVTVALAGFAHWQGDPEVWSWSRQLAEVSGLDGDLRIALHGAAAQAAYLVGDLTEAERHARTGLQAAGDRPPRRWWWCTVGLHVVAMYRAAYDEAERLALEAARAPDVTSTWSVVLAGNVALARLYGGDAAGARRALDRCRDRLSTAPSTTARAWVLYVEGEIAAVDDPARAVVALEACIELAGLVGATFVSGVATVGLAAAATRLGDAASALARFPAVIRHWHRTGMWVQQWSTLRNLAALLIELGRDAPAAVLLAAAEHDEGAAAVTGDGAARLDELRHTLEVHLGVEELGELSRSARAMSRDQVVTFALHAAAGAEPTDPGPASPVGSPRASP